MGFFGDLDYMHARVCSSTAGRFLSIDPINSGDPREPQSWLKYTYALNNPLKYVDPDGRDALAVTFVGFRVGTSFGRQPLGHSGVAISKGGRTTYYEFGRYGGGVGRVRYNGPLPNFRLGKNGLPTQSSLKGYLSAVTLKAGQNKPVEGAYFVNDQADAMLQYATDRMADPSKQGAYNAASNNCATFCEDVLEAGGEDLDVSLVNSPGNVMQELQDAADFSVSYDPGNDKLTITCGGKDCPE